MTSRDWRFSRKSENWHAMGPKLRIWREPIKRVGSVVRESEAAWLVQLEGVAAAVWLPKKHVQRELAPDLTVEDSVWVIPPWLWDKLTAA